MHLTRLLACSLLLSRLLPHTFASAELFVSNFKLVNANTSTVYRFLTQFDVIRATFPWTIIAVVTPSSYKPRSVTFTSPLARTEYFAPYALSGDTQAKGLRAVKLTPGPYKLSAYVDANTRLTNELDFLFHPLLPIRGPLQSELESTSPGYGTGLDIPLSTCGRTSPPRLRIEYIAQTSYDEDCVEALLGVDWCSGKNSVRVRTFRFEHHIFPNRTATIRTTVLSQRMYDNVQYGALVFNFKQCESVLFYYEACVRSRTGQLMCVTSPLKYMPHKVVPEPRLKYRPPMKLQLAPGDSVKIRTVTEGREKRRYDYVLQGVVRRRNGHTSTTPWKEGAAIETDVTNVSRDDDGAEVFLRYAQPWCRDNIASWHQRYSTRLTVREDIMSLARQDSSLPSFSAPVSRPVSVGEVVTLYVNATNTGGGKRKDGTLTQLHYQWYLQSDDYLESRRGHAVPIPGAKASVLRIDPTKCATSGHCSRLGSASLQLYYVDVCNTYGCRRSTPIRPIVLPPKGIGLDE